jgi:hypothetical protein
MRAKLFGVCALALAGALLFSAGAPSQPPGGKDTSGQTRVIPAPGYGGLSTADADLNGYDLRQLADELARVRREKAALERRERALLALIPQRIEAERKELSDLERRLKEIRPAKERKSEGKKSGG